MLSVIQRFHNRGESVDDLFQVGCIGLIKAIDNFNTELGVRFSTYAVPMIIGEIRHYLRDNNPIRVSRSLRDLAYKALRSRDALVYRLNREPDIREIAEEMDAQEEDVATWRWRPFRIPCRFSIPSIRTVGTPFMCSTR